MWYRPGDVVRVRVKGMILHEGIMTEHGRVINNSQRRGRVVEESFRDFSAGLNVKNIGPISGMPAERVLANARARLGWRYQPYSFNCQHFVRECYGLGRVSPQKRLAVGAGVVALIAAIL